MSEHQELKEIVDKLQKLLDDPHPGLFTWNDALRLQCRKMATWLHEHRVHVGLN